MNSLMMVILYLKVTQLPNPIFLNQQFIYKQSIKYFEKALENYLKNDNFRFVIKNFRPKF